MSDVASAPSGSGPRGWRDALASAGVVIAALGIATAAWLHGELAARPTVDQCDALIDRFVDLASRVQVHDVSDRAVAARQLALRGQPLRQTERRRCERALTAAQVRCALDAPTLDELERCVQ